MRPIKGTYPDYYQNYILLVSQETLFSALTETEKQIQNFIQQLPQEIGDYAYTEGKWTVKEVLLHITDTERILSYRALRFARKDEQQPLPFEENDYAANSNADKRTIQDILEEFINVRQATISLFRHFSDNVLARKGQTTLGTTTVNALGFFLCGHANHHINVLSERYLKNNLVFTDKSYL